MTEIRLIICPDPDDADAAELLVDGNVGDQAYRFLLDTGAARTSLGLDEYTAAFPASAGNQSSGVFTSSCDELITVPSVQVGPILKREVTVTRVQHHGSRMRNLLGMDLLHEHRCHFLFDQSTVRIDSPTEAPLLTHGQDLFLDEKFHPYIEVVFGPEKASAVWDTGAGITIADMDFIQQHPSHFQAAGTSTGTDSTGASRETPMFLMAGVVIGGCPFPAHRVAGVDLSRVNSTIERPMDLILGYSTLRAADWIFDFPARKWTISKSPVGEGTVST